MTTTNGKFPLYRTHMALPISRTQLDRLSDRIASADIISNDDLTTLGQILIAYREALLAVRSRLQDLGFVVASRLKTTDTLIEKLRREQSLKLRSVQDIAGARIVVADRHEQNSAVAAVTDAFRDKPARVRDRRLQPSSGYRAVHVIVFVAGLPVEIQVRTRLQDLWAQTYERLGDRWGRAIRYGGDPDRPAAALADDYHVTRGELVDELKRASDQINAVEGIRLGIRDEEQFDGIHTDDLAEIRMRISGLEQTMREGLTGIIRYAEGHGR